MENIFEGKKPTTFPDLMRTKCTDPSSVNPGQKNHEDIDTKAHQNQLAKNQWQKENSKSSQRKKDIIYRTKVRMTVDLNRNRPSQKTI